MVAVQVAILVTVLGFEASEALFSEMLSFLLTLQISKAPAVTRMVGVLVANLVIVAVLDVADLEIPAVTRIPGVLVANLVTVTVLDVAALEVPAVARMMGILVKTAQGQYEFPHVDYRSVEKTSNQQLWPKNLNRTSKRQ